MPDNDDLLLCFWATEGAVDGVEEALLALVERLMDRPWVLEHPKLQRAGDGEPHPGLILRMAPPDGLAHSDEVRHYEEVWELVWEVSNLSRNHGVVFEVDYHNEVIGSIELGTVDDGVRVMLLEEWAKHLGL